MYSSEVTPSVWTSTRSINRPVANPNTAPGSEPHNSPTDITMSGVRSALTPKIDTWETADSWITTREEAEQDEPERSLTALLTFTRHLRALGAGGRTGEDLHDVDAAQVGLRRDLDLPVVEQLVLVDGRTLPIGMLAGKYDSSGPDLNPAVTTSCPCWGPFWTAGFGGWRYWSTSSSGLPTGRHELAGVVVGVEHPRGHRQRVVGDQRTNDASRRPR